MYSYKESLKEEINISIKELFGLNVTVATADKLIESGILNLKSEIVKIDNSIYRKCICIYGIKLTSNGRTNCIYYVNMGISF